MSSLPAFNSSLFSGTTYTCTHVAKQDSAWGTRRARQQHSLLPAAPHHLPGVEMAKLCFIVYRNFVTADGLGHAGHGKPDRSPPLVRLVVGRNRKTKPFSFRRLASIDRAHLNLTLGTFQLLKTTQKLSESFLQTPRRTKVPSDQNEVLWKVSQPQSR